MYCPFCGVTVGKEFLFCPSCGRQLPRKPHDGQGASVKSRVIGTEEVKSMSLPKAKVPVWQRLLGGRRPSVGISILMIIVGLIICGIGYALMDDSTIIHWSGMRDSEYVKTYGHVGMTPWQWFMGIIGVVVNIAGIAMTYIGIVASLDRVRPGNRQHSIIAKATAIILCVLTFVIAVCIRGVLLNDSKGWSIWDYLILCAIWRAIWVGIVGPTTPSNASPSSTDMRTEKKVVPTFVPDSAVLNDLSVASGTDVENREETSKKLPEESEECPADDTSDSNDIWCALIFSIVIIVVVGSLVAAVVVACRANSKTASSMTVYPQESTHSIQDEDVDETCKPSTLQKGGGDMTSGDDVLDYFRQTVEAGNAAASGAAGSYDPDVLASVRQSMGLDDEKSTVKASEKIKPVNDVAAAETVERKVEEDKEPTLRVVASVDGKEVSGAKLDDGVRKHLIPVVWKLVGKKVYGPYKVSYESGNKRYVGNFDAVTVDWHGQKMISVTLKEDSEPWHGDIKTLTLPGGATMELIYVAPGSFMMGSSSSENGRNNDEAQHRVTLTKSFWMGKYEVTRKQWASVMGATSVEWDWDTRPVDNISWDDCQCFIQKVNAHLNCRARLPTEAEWEYACRANSIGPYNRNLDLDDMAWWHRNSGGVIHPVGEKRPNSWGFYDMCGNVSEWCNDWYASYTGQVNDPIGPATGERHVLRGGDRNSSSWDCRSASRSSAIPSRRNYGCGFRLVCSVGACDNGTEAPQKPLGAPNGAVALSLVDSEHE